MFVAVFNESYQLQQWLSNVSYRVIAAFPFNGQIIVIYEG